ncbi:MAG: hypothetical protein ABIO04_08080 [Ferruginibacter sp.]
MKQLSFLSLIFFIISSINASCQEKVCEVLMDQIKGRYTGNCIEGKAHGKGRSVGKDSYEGDFKNGYPDGFGEYNWENQDRFKGNWKKGRMEGTGEMYYKVGLSDSIVKGFWKKGKYIGLFEKQYDVVSNSSRIIKINCSLVSKRGEDINITMHQLSNPSRGLTELRVSNIIVLAGSYFSKTDQSMYNSSTTRFKQVVFPFRAIFTLNNGEIAEILFNEKGNYEVYVDMQ